MPQRNVATNFTFEQQRVEINNLAQDFWTHKGTVDTASTTYLKHDGSNAFTGQTLAVPNAFTINPNSGGGTVTIAGNLDVTGTTTTVSSANLEVTDKNILISKGSTTDAQADGAGITIDSATDITWNFVDANDAWVSSIGVEATTHVKAARGQFTGDTSPTTGSGVEVNAPDANTGQIIAYNRGTSTYNELRLRASSVPIYTGTTNAIVGTFNSTGLTMESGKNIAADTLTSTGDVSIGHTSPGSILDVRENKDGAETQIRLYNTDNGDTTTQTAAFYMSPDSRGAAYTGLRAIKENADFSTNAGRDISLTLNTVQNNAQVEGLRIQSDGNVGIGNDNPSQLLSLKSADPRILLTETTNNSNCFIDYAAGGILEISVDDNNVDANSKFQIRLDGGTAGLTLLPDSLLVGTTTSNTSDRFTIVDPGNAFMSLRSDQQADGNSQVIDFAVGTGNRSSGNLVSTITAAIPTGATAGGTLKGYLAFSSNAGDSLAERVRINEYGNLVVGVNPTTSSQGSGKNNVPLVVYGPDKNAINVMIGNSANGVTSLGADDYSGDIRFNGADVAWGDISYYPNGDGGSGSFRFTRNGSTVATNGNATIGCGGLRINSGQVLVGNTSDVAPDGFASLIQVNSANHTGSIQIGRHTANSNGPLLLFNKTRSGTANPGTAALSRDDMLGGMRFFGADGTDNNCNAGGIQAYMDGDASSNSFPGRLEFLTTTGGQPQGSVKMTISENGAIVTPLGSPLSYHATNGTYEIYNDDHDIQISDTTSGWHIMKQWTAEKSGQFFIKFQGMIQSGQYYWAYDVWNQTQGKRINQNGSGPSAEALNGVNACRFTNFLDVNETSAVHAMRRYKLKVGNNSGSYVGEVKPGDIIQLRMASSHNNGALVTGVGQNLRCENFRIYSDTPGKETGGKEFNPTNAAFHAIMGGQNKTFNNGDDLTWDSTTFNRGYTTDSNNATVEYGFDVGNDCFRVPHTGIYHFYVNFFVNVTSSCRISLEVDGTAYTSGYIWGCNTSEGQATANQGGSQSLYLGKGSVVKVTVQSGTLNSTYGGHTSWGGFLVG